MTMKILPLRKEDRPRWDVLARGYKTFYNTPLPTADYDATWQRLMAGHDVLFRSLR